MRRIVARGVNFGRAVAYTISALLLNNVYYMHAPHLFRVGKSLIPKYGSRQIRNCVQNITIPDSKYNPYKLTNLVRGQLENSIWFDMKFWVQNRDVNFASPLIQRNAATHTLSHCSLFAATRGPAQVQSAHHTQSSRAKLTCSSTAAWLRRGPTWSSKTHPKHDIIGLIFK